MLEETDEDDPVAALEPNDVGNAPARRCRAADDGSRRQGTEFPCVFVVRVASQSFPSNYKESLVEFPAAAAQPETPRLTTDPKTLHEQEERRLFYVAMTRAMDELYLCGKVGRDKKQPAPHRSTCANWSATLQLALKGAIDVASCWRRN